METISVQCNHCGAPLQVVEATRFVTCQFCNSRLEVKRTGSSIFTEEVAQIAKNTGKMAESLEVIALQSELERLGREHGHEHAGENVRRAERGPAGCVGIVMMAMITAFGIFFATSSSEAGAPSIFAIFGAEFALIGVLSIGKILLTMARPSEPDVGEHRYEARRAELVRRIDQLTRS